MANSTLLLRRHRQSQPQFQAGPADIISSAVACSSVAGWGDICRTNGAFSQKTTEHGLAAVLGSGSWIEAYHNSKSSVYTLIAIGAFTHGTAQRQILDDDNVGVLRCFQLRSNNNGIDFIPFDNAGSPTTLTVSTAGFNSSSGAIPKTVIARAGNGKIALSVSGCGSTSGTIASVKPLSGSVYVGNFKSSGSIVPNTDGILSYAVIPEYLSDAQVAQILQNPWQIFAQRKSRLFADISASGAQSLTPSLYTNGQSFYLPTVSQSGGTQTLTPALFTNSASFYAATLTASNTLAPSLFSNAQSFYGLTLQASYAVTPGLYTNASSFFAATLATTNALLPSLYTNGQTFYSPTVSIAGGPQQLTANRIDNTSVFYAPTLAPGAVSVAPSLYNNIQAFYALTVTTSKTLVPALFTNSNVLYDPVVSLGSGPQVISPTLFVNTQSYFTQTVFPGSVSLFPVLLANSSTFYAPSVSNGSFSGSISDADINRIVAAVLAALNSTTIPVNAVMGWPSPSDIADAVWNKQLP